MLIKTNLEGIPEYPKIETLFERDKATFVVDPSRIKSPVLETISQWDVTEKIDGTNIRVILSPNGEVAFGGRSANAQLPAPLMRYLGETFKPDALKATLWPDGPEQVVLFGEGYGAGIQKGGSYRQDQAFILFDALVGGKWWLPREALSVIAANLEIEEVPYLGRWTLPQIVEHVRSPFPSKIGTAMAEGIVAKPIEELFNRKGERVIIKLKTKDFVSGKR